MTVMTLCLRMTVLETPSLAGLMYVDSMSVTSIIIEPFIWLVRRIPHLEQAKTGTADWFLALARALNERQTDHDE